MNYHKTTSSEKLQYEFQKMLWKHYKKQIRDNVRRAKKIKQKQHHCNCCCCVKKSKV